MKLAITSQNKKTVTGHAGRCQKFWIYDIENDTVKGKELVELSKDDSFHFSSPQQAHPLDTVQVLISNSMGQGLTARLESKGIRGIVTPETDLDAVVKAYIAGDLVTAESCDDHDHHHDHDHEHGHGHGHQHRHGQDHDCQCNG